MECPLFCTSGVRLFELLTLDSIPLWLKYDCPAEVSIRAVT
ncbi:hypothetical protein DFR67_12016 [Williamsia limnetica]|uniref:Uncharacterized protein n=1 Tax=Williamsia limnetica TaxID=882452 RepID=A0A318RAH6_WILLI|nr:hypothetical protein DFR67_12016 [Williamsia limnetica]